ncbi:hypothetical protein NDU88_002252 [Pleurodeles waltl]|uniref:Uncharacterized protein n=1 Tax=Pleurodeles waltl TaxID=8319 RepID=A0AAV7UWG3_PLEWA|nr:hypothetical protein NDU88_002252 [Pleurodeles waltl]
MGYSPPSNQQAWAPPRHHSTQGVYFFKIVEEYVPAGEGAPQAEESQRRRCAAGRAAPGALSAPAPQQQPRPR